MRGLPDPPIVVDGIRSKGNPLGKDTEREHEVTRSGRGNDHLIGKAEEAGPENSLEGGFPAAPVAGSKCRGVRAKKESGFRKLRGDTGDPKRGIAVAGKTEDGIEISSVNEFPEAGIEEAEERFCAGAAITVWDQE